MIARMIVGRNGAGIIGPRQRLVKRNSTAS